MQIPPVKHARKSCFTQTSTGQYHLYRADADHTGTNQRPVCLNRSTVVVVDHIRLYKELRWRAGRPPVAGLRTHAQHVSDGVVKDKDKI